MVDPWELQFVEAIKNPVKAGILRFLHDRNGGAKEIALHIGEPVAKVRYHLRALRQAGLVAIARVEARRGALERYMSLTARSYMGDEAYASLEPEERQRLTNFWLRLIVDDITRLIKIPATYDEHPPHTVRVRMALDEQGWREISDILSEALPRIEEAKMRATERLEEGSEESFPVSVFLVALEMPPESHGEIPLGLPPEDGEDLP